MLHYNPRHVSSSTMLIFWRTYCTICPPEDKQITSRNMSRIIM